MRDVLQPQLPFDVEEDRGKQHQRAFARLWLGCRDSAKRKGYALDVSDERWKKVEREAR